MAKKPTVKKVVPTHTEVMRGWVVKAADASHFAPWVRVWKEEQHAREYAREIGSEAMAAFICLPITEVTPTRARRKK